MLATVGQLLVNESLPPELRDYTRTLGQDEINDLLGRVAREYPEKYKEISWKLVQLGRNAAFDEGATITLNDLVPVVDKKPLLDIVRKQEQAIRSDKTLTEEQKDEAIETLYGEATKRLTEETYANALANKNPFALQAKYKARGNKNQLGAMLTSPGTYTDSSGKIVPIFIGSAYAEGLKPHEYWAAGYGARLGILGTKLGTQKGGYLSKMMNAAAIDQVVTEDDCGTANGLPVSVNDDDNIGSVLQQDAAGFKAGTVITKPVLDKIRAAGEDEIVIRSPITCSCKNGLCKRCVGIRENGRFPEIGYNAGVNAASALGEQIAQNSLNCLVEGTLVRMADGSVKPIEQVNPGDYVIGSDINGNLAPTRVVDRYDNGFQPCVDTKFVVNGTHRSGAGIHLLSTTEHPILGTRFVSGQKEEVLNWVPRMLKAGLKSKHFFAYGPSSFDDAGYKNEPLAMLLGALVGDGCYTKSVSGVHLSCSDELEIEDLRRSVAELDLSLNRLKYHDGIYYRISRKNNGENRGENCVLRYLIDHGMYGKYAHDKDVPPEIWLWDNKSVSSFIGGFIAADGSVYARDKKGNPGVSLASTSYTLLSNIRDLLLVRFGVMTSEITNTGKVGTYCRKHAQYQITITKGIDVRRLSETIRIPGVKRERLSDLISAAPTVKREERSAFRRVEQTSIGVRHVYDLEVACKDHIYLLANGLIVHNTKHCLAYGTKVRMADWSEKAIQDIVVGDHVLGSDLQGNLRPVKVLATFDNGRQTCVRSFFKKHGTSHKGATYAILESTSAHKILGAPDRGEAPCQIAVGTKCRRFLAFTASTYTAPRLKHEPLAALAGVLIGDCCYSSTAKTLRLSSQDPLEISDLKKGLKGLDVSFHRRTYPYVTYYRLDGKAVSSFLRREKMFGQTIPHRTLPASIHSWDNASVSSFIGGFVASTGSVSRDGRFSTITISVPATSLCLLEGVKQLLRDRFGILTTAITISRSAGSCDGKHNVPHTQYRLDITARPALEEFARLIPVPGRKRRLLKRLLKDVPQPRLRKQQCLELAQIERIGVRHVYDIMVDCPDHLFLLANGLIVSNSGKRSDLGSYVGFDALKNLAMVPKAYDVKASVTPRDGSVSAIEDAPQGGQYVILDDDTDQKIYVPPTLKVSVKPGEKLEAGDAVSTGLVSPSDIVAYKGIGEGRRYFTDRFRKVFTDSHYDVNRRNVEILSRALVNNVQIENPDAEGDALPGDIVRYSAWAGAYTPRTGAAQTPIDKSIGQYLETPVLHYTVGTRITPSVVKTLKKHGRTDVLVNKTAPGVVPHMVSVVEAPAYSGDWMARLGTSYLKDRLLEDAQVGAHSELHGTNPIPGLAKGVEFGKDMAHTGAY